MLSRTTLLAHPEQLSLYKVSLHTVFTSMGWGFVVASSETNSNLRTWLEAYEIAHNIEGKTEPRGQL